MNEAEAVDLVSDRPARRGRRRPWWPTSRSGRSSAAGVDSSLIVALATEARGRPDRDLLGRLRRRPLRRAAPRPPGQPAVRHQPPRGAWCGPTSSPERWRQLTWHRDAPLSEPADIAVYELAELARRSVKVLLSGEGSDELFAGYPKYRMARYDRAGRPGPGRLRGPAPWAGPSARRRPRPAGPASRCGRCRAPTEMDRLESWFAPFTAAERERLLPGSSPVRCRRPGCRGDDAIERMLAFDCAGWLADNLLERGDRMAMAASVELRPPFLDHQLVALAFSLPSTREGPPRPDQVGPQGGGPSAPAHQHHRSAQGRLPGAARRSGSGATCATWPATCCWPRTHSWATPWTGRAVAELLDSHEAAGGTSRSGSGPCSHWRCGIRPSSASRPDPVPATPARATVTVIDRHVQEPGSHRRAASRACIDQVPEDGSTVVVFDNASDDGTAELVESTFPTVDVVRSEDNLGFARACNRAAAMATTELHPVAQPGHGGASLDASTP